MRAALRYRAGVKAVAIVNGNARGVRGRIRKRLDRALPGGVRFTDSLVHARATIRAEIARGVDLVILGGGDGTVVMGLTLIAEACRGTGRPSPRSACCGLARGTRSRTRSERATSPKRIW